jgi:hypothetical protein
METIRDIQYKLQDLAPLFGLALSLGVMMLACYLSSN